MYFKTSGAVNSSATVELAIKNAKECGIKHIVVASNTGDTARLLVGCGLNVVCVTSAYGSREEGVNPMSEETRAELTQKGIKLVTASHVLSGVERGISTQVQGMYPAEMIAYTLRMLGQGTKVCVEIAIMALDAGQIPFGEKVIAIGGTGRGADTAAILTPAHANKVFKTKIHEIICKPEL